MSSARSSDDSERFKGVDFECHFRFESLSLDILRNAVQEVLRAGFSHIREYSYVMTNDGDIQNVSTDLDAFWTRVSCLDVGLGMLTFDGSFGGVHCILRMSIHPMTSHLTLAVPEGVLSGFSLAENPSMVVLAEICDLFRAIARNTRPRTATVHMECGGDDEYDGMRYDPVTFCTSEDMAAWLEELRG